MNKIFMAFLPITLVIIGLLVIDVAFYFITLISGLVMTGISLMIIGFLIGTAINELAPQVK